MTTFDLGTVHKTETMLSCPECDSAMALRSGRNGKFYGCTRYPSCRGTRNYRSKKQKEFTPSHYQQAIFDFVKNGSGHAVIKGVAGCGKTTTNIASLEFTDPDKKVALVAFNRHIAREQAERAPEHVTACTLHSLGLRNIKAATPDVVIEPKKLWHIIDDLISETNRRSLLDILDSDSAVIVRLVSLCKATMRRPTMQNLSYIADRYGININGNEWMIFTATRIVFSASIAQTDIIDYDDMIYFCAAGLVPCDEFDFLVVDECQDLNNAQIEMALKSVKADGRIIASGDEFQSCYGFRGADTDAVPNIEKALDATSLPLSISYRCCKAVGRLVNAEFPHVPFEISDSAPEGIVTETWYGQMLSMAKPGDLVLCRVNAPLVEPAFELIRRGVKAVILGRDIGKGLQVLISKVSKKHTAYDLNAFLRALSDYGYKEVSKLLAAKKTTRAATLQDQMETIIALADGVYTLTELKRRVDQVFSDKHDGVTFSSIHKAKGGEADRVFILHPELMPHKLAQQPWELQQEENIRYVAYTRAKRELYFVQ